MAKPVSPDEGLTPARLAAKHGLSVSGARPSLVEYVRQLWGRRHFIIAFSQAKLTAQYSQAKLGQLWQVVTPLLNAAVYFFIFGVLLVVQDISERKRTETELLTAIEAVMQDTSWFSRGIIEKLAQLRAPAPATRDVAELAQLTAREREVLGLLCQGHDDDGIARQLRLSRNTVRNHVATIYSKIGVHRRSAAIVWARDRGITGYEKPKARGKSQPD